MHLQRPCWGLAIILYLPVLCMAAHIIFSNIRFRVLESRLLLSIRGIPRHGKMQSRIIRNGFGEVLGNPGLEILNIPELAGLAHSHDIPLLVDATFVTPHLCRPYRPRRRSCYALGH